MVKVLDTGESPQENQEEIAVAQEENTSIASVGRCGFDSLPSEALAQILELVVESAWRDGPRRSPTLEEMGTFPREERDDGARPTASGDGGDRILSYPTLLLLVCRRWFAIVLDTPMIWSFLSITDDSTLDNISLSLERSKSYPLSIRVSFLSRKTEYDEISPHFVNAASDLAKFFRCLADGVPATLPDDFYPETVLLKDLLREKMSLLLQHAERWTRFLFFAAQPRFIHLSASMIRSNSHRLRSLTEFGLQSVLSCKSDFDLTEESIANQKTFWFDEAMPFLQKMALARCRFPASISFYFIQETFPALVELEIAQTEGRSFASLLKLLNGLPQLRFLTIIQTLCTREERLQRLYRRPVSLDSLEELTIQESNGSTLEHFFNLVSVPNVESLSLIRTGLFDAFADAIKDFSLLPNILKLRLEGVWVGDEEACVLNYWDERSLTYQFMEKLILAMPKLSSIHIDKKLRTFALLDQPSRSLPELLEMSLSGLSDESIENIVAGWYRSGLAVETLRMDKESIVSEAVKPRDWASLQCLVKTLRWFDCDTEVKSESLKLSQSAVRTASKHYGMMADDFEIFDLFERGAES